MMRSQASRHIRIDTSVVQAKIWHQAGISALATDELEIAVRSFRRAVQLNPKHAAAWNDLGVVMEALGNPSEAVSCYSKVLHLKPDHPQALANLGNLSLQLRAASMLHTSAFSAAC